MFPYFLTPHLKLVNVETDEKVLDIFLPISLFNKYVIRKLSTKYLPATWTDPINGDIYSIIWVNAFSIQPLNGSEIDPGNLVEYEVQFDKPNLGNRTDIRAFYYANKDVNPFDDWDSADLGNGRWAVRLRIPDPGVGLGGK